MIGWSRMHTLVAGTAIVVVTNVVALAGVAYNRSGDAESTLQLSDRELREPSSWGFESENSGIALRMRWRVLGKRPDDDQASRPYFPISSGPPEWLNSAKMAELGFDVSSTDDSSDSRSRYSRQLPKEVLLVLELDGPAYHEMLARAEAYVERTADGRNQLERERNENTRLFVVDAGLDADELRERYPSRSRHAIVRGTIRPWVVWDDNEATLAGHVSALSVSQINVPLAFRAPFDRQHRRSARTGGNAPFTVTVAYGRRLEPWIVSTSGGDGAR